MLIIKNNIIPFGKSYAAINLFGVIFTKVKLDETGLRHEMIHTVQQRELLFVGFFLLYLAEWFVRLLICRNLHQAYYTISFEQEAYRNQHDKEYLRRRKHFAWMGYIKP